MDQTKVTFANLSVKTIVVHTVTYFVMGLLALVFLDYAHKFAEPGLRTFMRQTSEPIVAAGPLFQPIRGFLFALAFYPIRSVLFGRKNGWAVMWLILVTVGILSTFGPSPGSLEGIIYTNRPLYLQLFGLPEVLIQSLLLSVILCYWVDHDKNKRITWAMWIMFVLVVLLSALGVIMRLSGA